MDTSDDPITIAAGASAGLGVVGKLQEGKELEQISKQRAAVDRANAAAVERRAGVAAKIKLRQGRTAIASQRARTAASGIVVGMGSPVVQEAQLKADILQDVGFILEGGDVDRRSFLASADLEERQGKRLRRASTFSALQSGLSGASNVATRFNDTGFFDEDVFGAV